MNETQLRAALKNAAETFSDKQMTAFGLGSELGKSAECQRIAAWLDSNWPADLAEEREYRRSISANLRQNAD